MEVTDVRVRKVAAEGRMRAFASVTLDDQFVVHDIRIINGEHGLFVAMPSKRLPSGDYRDVAHPITSAMRQLVQDRVLAAYNQQDEEDSKAS
ncbi:MAG: septation regulator SpoVG [Firmicutes bacterium]|nr:septation regulator SpoVG [Bacillota bacterium]